MKRIILIMFFSIAMAGLQVQTAPTDHFFTIREIADAMKGVVAGVKLLVNDLLEPINEYGVDAVVTATAGGITKIIEDKEITFEVKYGSFAIDTGIAKGRTFEYVAIIREKNTDNVKILHYFNVSDNSDSLTVSIPGYFSDAVPLYVKSLEAYCSTLPDGSGEMLVSIAADQTSIPRSSMRFIVNDNGTDISVSALAAHVNTDTSVSGYYTLGFIAHKEGDNKSSAFQGASAAAEMSNNGYDYPGQETSYNNGYFFNNNGAPGTPSYGVSTEDPAYPSFDSLNTVYTLMQNEMEFFYAGEGANASALSVLTIDITAYPVQ